MTDNRNVVHATFVLERTYPVSRARVFDAFSDADRKRDWFTGLSGADHSLDFRVGGRETSHGKMPNGGDMHYDAVYFDIVPGQRIVYAYEMRFGDQRISATLTTVELDETDGGTRLKFTEQGAYLDGFDGPAYWERGTTSLLERLGQSFEE
ncbi:MAG TPA: SRPBCC family protein [Devosiaceae bacterium]